jgi:anti-sigma factor RsiW
MTDDEVRDLFSAYHDHELPAEQHERVRAALAASPALKREYEAFCAMLGALSGLGAEAPASKLQGAELRAPNGLIEGVQRRIHKRSKGKFYADRWSRVAGLYPLELLAALLLVGLVVAYVAMTMVSVESAGQAPVPTAPAR